MKIYSLMLFGAISVLLCLILMTSCDNNVYLGASTQSKQGLWRVGDQFFDSFQEAMTHVGKGLTEKSIVLQRHVHEGERGGGILVPPNYSGHLIIDFNGFTYEFEDSTNHFLLIMGDAEVIITGGKTVIYNEASHIPEALDIRAGSAILVSHIIDDRRVAHNKYEFGIGQIIVPTLPTIPSGDLDISLNENIFTVRFVPHPNSSVVQAVFCRYLFNGRWSDLLPAAENGSFSFTAAKKGEYKVVLQVLNDGGTISLENTINYLP